MTYKPRQEGEYPFFPTKPEHEVLKHVPFMVVIDESTGEERHTLDYGHGYQGPTLNDERNAFVVSKLFQHRFKVLLPLKHGNTKQRTKKG